MSGLLPYHSVWPEAGCDEAGRGCLAGPVFGAAVILPEDYKHKKLNDSKQLSRKQRELLRFDIEKHAIAWSVALVSPNTIDKINILQASILAMHKALDTLQFSFLHVVVDGNRFRSYKEVPHTCVVKGDGKYLHIAAASILAKTHRDEYMLDLHKAWPQYAWNENMGYPTVKHREAISCHGISPFHRKSFKLLKDPEQLELFSPNDIMNS